MENKYGLKFRIFDRAFLKSVSFMLFLYWMILVIWQNVNEAGNTLSTFDTALKVGLILYLVVYFLSHANKISSKILAVLGFAIMLLITFFLEQSIDLRTIINYAFPVLFAMVVYVFGDDFKINKAHLIAFFNCVIILVSYTAIYAVIFCTDQFINAFSITNAYGNELTSFFLSSHEYGMYLSFAIIGCLLCLRFKSREAIGAKILYILALILLVPNLILTYSRTSIYATVIALVLLVLFDGNKKFKRCFFGIAILAILLILIIPTLRDFVFEIVMKGNNDAGRNELYQSALDYYRDGTAFEKIFGRGFDRTSTFFKTFTEHNSAHNAYIQVLISCGGLGLLVMIIFLICQFYLNVKLIRQNRFMGAIFIAMLLSASAMMFTNTAIIFRSPIDSYFLTVLAIVVPKFVRNAINSGEFDKEVQ